MCVRYQETRGHRQLKSIRAYLKHNRKRDFVDLLHQVPRVLEGAHKRAPASL